MAAKRDQRIASATFFAAQVDFTYAGRPQGVRRRGADRARSSARWPSAAISTASKMANAFNMLRSNDLIWPYVINNYLKGKEPMPFDLLYWNSDSTRMPAANHSFYLRNCYLDNNLAHGRDGDRRQASSISSKVKVPVYNLATREDHIAPAKSVLLGSKYLRRAGEASCSPAPATSPA